MYKSKTKLKNNVGIFPKKSKKHTIKVEPPANK